jgi:hypothetical protein
MLARDAYELTEALHLLPNGRGTELLRDYLEHSLRQILPALIRLAALHRPDVPVDACIQIFLAGDRAHLPYVLELLDAILPPVERQQIASFLEPSPLEARAAAARKQFPDIPSKIEEWLQSAIHSGNEWLSAIALEYSLETDVGNRPYLRAPETGVGCGDSYEVRCTSSSGGPSDVFNA